MRERERFESAVVLVQRRWREVVSERVRRLEGDVGVFQKAARGWLVKRRVNCARKRGERRLGW